MPNYQISIDTEDGTSVVTFTADAHENGGGTHKFTNVTNQVDPSHIFGKELTLAGPNYNYSARYSIDGAADVNFFHNIIVHRVKITYLHSGIAGDPDIILVRAYFHE